MHIEHYSIHTEKNNMDTIKRYIWQHDKRHVNYTKC